MDMSPLPLYWVAVKGEPDETSQKKELVDFKETIMGPESPDELKCSSPMEFSTQQFCSATFKSELEEVDTDVSFKTSPETEVIDSKEIITRELVPELPKELKYSPPVDLSLDPFSSEDVKIEPEEIDPDLSYNTLPRSEEEDLMTEMPGDIIKENSSDGTSPNCASYSMPSSSGGVGELPTIGNLCTLKDEIIAPYACSWCSGRFRNKLQLRTHLHSFHIKSEDVVFSCSICDNIHLKRTEFMKHILEFHPRMNVHICPVCREVFHAYWDLHEHLSDYSDNDSYLCARCGEMFPARSTVEQYMEMEEEYSSRSKTETPGDIINGNSSDGTSPNCASYSMPSSSGGVGELPTIGNLCTSKDEIITPYACSWCSGRFRNKCQLRTHLHSFHNIKSEDVVFSCSVCGKIYLKRTEFMKHVLEFHPRMNVHICPVCREVFHAYWDLHEHLSDYSDNDSYLCAKCGEMFPTRSILEQHMKMEEEYSSRPKVCVIELYKESPHNQDIKTNTKEMEFYEDSPHNRDIKSNTKEIEFYKDSPRDQDIKGNTQEILTCDVSAKSFSQTIAFAPHISSHSNDDQLDCPRCEQKFATQSSLLTHLRGHKSCPFMCGTCNMRFSRWSYLLQHKTIHYNYDFRPYRCSKCQNGFATSYGLTRHMNIYNGACTSTARRLPIYFHRTYALIKTP
ncbi:zinc finger protein 530 isoform X2 [Anabrus simplex]|uniref:zinc finger protein 530 isoform X2 n=1 Tax=Anabrus simplex TaxID=316456 RepID=UPI0035A3A9DF